MAMHGAVPTPWWDLPARMLIATTIVLALTAAAAFVGARTAGVLASFPVFGAILAIFAHRIRGATMATQVLRGMEPRWRRKYCVAWSWPSMDLLRSSLSSAFC
jgi:hypothetical protein